MLVDAHNEELRHLFSANGTRRLVVKLAEHDANDNLIYEGWAFAGSSTSASVWRIRKRFYDGAGNFSYWGWSDGLAAWDNRATTATYVSYTA